MEEVYYSSLFVSQFLSHFLVDSERLIFVFLSVGWQQLWGHSDNRLVEADLLLSVKINSGRWGAE